MIDWFTQLIVDADIIFLLILFFSEKKNPSKILLWGMVMLFIPLLGFILYLFVGQTFYADNKYKKKGLKDEEINKVLPTNEDLLEADPEPDYKRTAKAVLNAGGLGFSNNNDVKLYTLGEDKFKDLYEDLCMAGQMRFRPFRFMSAKISA